MGLLILKRALLFLLLLSSYCLSAKELKLNKIQQKPETLYRLQSLATKYSRQRLIEELRNFVECCRPGRLVGTEAHQEAVKYIEKNIKALALDTNLTIQKFKPDLNFAINSYEADFEQKIASNFKKESETYKKWRLFTDEMKSFLSSLGKSEGTNLIWEKKGSLSPSEVLIIGANFDSVNLDLKQMKLMSEARAPGADDNGSGVAIAFALIEVLSRIELPKTVRVVFFDYGEFGALGSRAYLDQYKEELKQNKMRGFINLLMLGHDSKTSDQLKKEGNMKAYIRMADDAGFGQDKLFASSLLKVASRVSASANFGLESNDQGLTDAQSFWRARFPAVVFSGDWENDPNPRQHTADDFIETINQKSFYNNYKFVLGAVVGWAYDIVP